MGKITKTRETTPRDVDIGRRIRIRRIEIGLSQGALGAALGLTFQQIQKYERGANRVAVNRLDQIATTLKVSIAYFFDAKDAPPPAGFLGEALVERDAVQLVRAFASIEDPRHRHAVLELARSLAPEDGKRARPAAAVIANGRAGPARRLHG
jgi:transcriptional regulator with XRE-family HTH domain